MTELEGTWQRLTHNLSVPDDEGRQYVVTSGEWKLFPVTGKPYLTPREQIPWAFRAATLIGESAALRT